jgi:PKD repeat protein
MRRFFLLVAFLVLVPPAHAAPPAVAIEASSLLGAAPLDVTLSAVGDADSFAWDFGDGSRAEGRVVQHRYLTGRYTATVTAAAAGETAQASATVTALALTLAGPRAGAYGRRVTLRGRLLPALRGAWVELRAGDNVVSVAKTDRAGRVRFRVRLAQPQTYEARFGPVVSNALEPVVRPALDTSLARSRMMGQRLVLRARLRPAQAGRIQVSVWRSSRKLRSRSLGSGGTLRLPSGRPGDYVVRVAVEPSAEYGAVSRTLRATVVRPHLGRGSRGPSVRILERRLSELGYALRGVNGFYGFDTYDAVLAFQKVHRLARTGRVGPGVWSRLQRARRPRPRVFGGSHIEVDKGRQVLFEVRRGRVVRVVHVSTGATGNTPVGRWRVYRKVVGWDWVLWYPMYFLRGFAIHGYPSVPVYPASHGCVRVPMWIAPSLFSGNPYGRTIHVY